MSGKILSVFSVVLFVCFLPVVIFCGITRVFDTQEDWNACGLEHCDTLSIPGSVKILRIYDDEFSGDELNDFWSWEVGKYNEHDRGYCDVGNLESGHIWIITWGPKGMPKPLTEWWGSLDTAPKIYQQLDFNDDFEIETLKAYTAICSGNINIRYSLLREAKKAEILVKDSTGRTKTTFEGEGTLGEKDILFNVSGYANGVYFVKFSVEKKNGKFEKQVKKFVAKK